MRKILHIQVVPKLSGVQKVSLEILKSLPNEEYEKWILFSDTIDCGDKEERESVREGSLLLLPISSDETSRDPGSDSLHEEQYI